MIYINFHIFKVSIINSYQDIFNIYKFLGLFLWTSIITFRSNILAIDIKFFNTLSLNISEIKECSQSIALLSKFDIQKL